MLPRWKVEPAVDLLLRELSSEVRCRPKGKGGCSHVPFPSSRAPLLCAVPSYTETISICDKTSYIFSSYYVVGFVCLTEVLCPLVTALVITTTSRLGARSWREKEGKETERGLMFTTTGSWIPDGEIIQKQANNYTKIDVAGKKQEQTDRRQKWYLAQGVFLWSLCINKKVSVEVCASLILYKGGPRYINSRPLNWPQTAWSSQREWKCETVWKWRAESVYWHYIRLRLLFLCCVCLPRGQRSFNCHVRFTRLIVCCIIYLRLTDPQSYFGTATWLRIQN